MITMSVCFIIFSGSGITMNAKGLVSQLISVQGGDLVLSTDTRNEPYSYDYENLENYLKEYDERFPNRIRSWCWSSKSFSSIETVGNTRLTPLSLFPRQRVFITGVDKTVMTSVRQELYVPNEYQDGTSYGTLDDGTQDGVSAIFDQTNSVTTQVYDPKNIISFN
jgi:hypothetical protein